MKKTFTHTLISAFFVFAAHFTLAAQLMQVESYTRLTLAKITNNTDIPFRIYTNEKFLTSTQPEMTPNLNTYFQAAATQQSTSYETGFVYKILHDPRTQYANQNIAPRTTANVNIDFRDSRGILNRGTIMLVPEYLGGIFANKCSDVAFMGIDDANFIFGVSYRINQSIGGISCCCLDQQCKTKCTQDTLSVGPIAESTLGVQQVELVLNGGTTITDIKIVPIP